MEHNNTPNNDPDTSPNLKGLTFKADECLQIEIERINTLILNTFKGDINAINSLKEFSQKKV